MTRNGRSHRNQEPHKTSYVPRTQVLHNAHYSAERKKLERELERLFAKRNKSRGDERTRLETELNGRVEAWNVEFLKKETSFDLHYMTPDAAVDFVVRMVERRKNRGDFELITGKGLHSKNGVARIKEQLQMEYTGCARCHIKEMEGNAGRLLLSLW